MSAFLTPVDIANKALSVLRQPAIYSFQDNTVQAIETARVYDPLRLAELRRSLWVFSTRRIVLRALTTTAFLFTPPAWSSTTAYQPGDIVSYSFQTWTATTATTGDTPGIVPAGGRLVWESYFGPMAIDVWNSPVEPAASPNAGNLQPTAYFPGELVYKTPGDGTYTVYRSLITDNAYDPAGVDTWVDDTVYTSGQVVSFNSTNYQSLHDLNFNNEPDTSPSQWTTTITSPLVSNSWRAVSSAVLSKFNIVYPLGAGPAGDTRTRNAYRLPAGYLRQAPNDPKADINPFLGAPTGNMMPDWVFESDYIVSRNANPLMLRFVADMQSVPEYDPLFGVALAHRLAIELAPRLADGEMFASIIADAREEYARTISEARTINGIEAGPVSPYEDDYITCRL